MKALTCADIMEIPYYSCGLFAKNICMICGGEVPGDSESSGAYPTCSRCTTGSTNRKRSYSTVVLS